MLHGSPRTTSAYEVSFGRVVRDTTAERKDGGNVRDAKSNNRQGPARPSRSQKQSIASSGRQTIGSLSLNEVFNTTRNAG